MLRAEQPGDVGTGHQPVADRKGVRGDRALPSAGHRPAGPVDRRDGDTVDAVPAVRADHRMAEVTADSAAEDRQAPSDALAKEGGSRRESRKAGKPFAGTGQIHDGGDFGAGGESARCDRDEKRPDTGDDQRSRRHGGLRLEEDGRGGKADDARQRPAVKGHDALMRSGRADQSRRRDGFVAAGTERIDPEMAADHPCPPASAPLDAGSRKRLAQPLAVSQIMVGARNVRPLDHRRAVDLAARALGFVENADVEAAARGFHGRRGARRSAADDDEIAGPAQIAPLSSTDSPSRTLTMQACRSRPSIMIAHSWQTPMKQKAPRGARAFGLWRNCRMPAARSAAATLWPGRAAMLRPSTSMVTTGGEGAAESSGIVVADMAGIPSPLPMEEALQRERLYTIYRHSVQAL